MSVQSLIMAKNFIQLFTVVVVLFVFSDGAVAADRKGTAQSLASQKCVNCHKSVSPGIVEQWKQGAHFKQNVGCLDCHRGDPSRPDAKDHNGEKIVVVVTPKNCGQCHAKASEEFQKSHHADAGKIMGSLDNVLAEVVEGYTVVSDKGEKIKPSAVAVSGCLQCHGSEVKVLKDGTLDPATWPNTGVGRLNPDGSKGSCSACHFRHNFSVAQARQPENCGRCHMGPDHPQLEVYNESKHGIAFAANRARLAKGMEKKSWVPGKDYEQGPTCASCHMGATRSLKATHDVGERISWTLRPAVSEKIDAAAIKLGKKDVKTWEKRREDMQDVCLSCHTGNWVNNFYKQFDNLVNLYNDKFGSPATELMKMLTEKKLIPTDVQFTTKIEFTYFYLWHHEGRRVRHGAAMMGPDYTQWHGMFEVADRFYTQFIPELKELLAAAKEKGGAQKDGANAVEKRMNEILDSDMHRWSQGKLSDAEKAARKKASDEFKKRYSQ